MPHDPRRVVIVTDAERLMFPAVPDGYRGLPKSHTACRNFQWGVAAYVAHLYGALPTF